MEGAEWSLKNYFSLLSIIYDASVIKYIRNRSFFNLGFTHTKDNNDYDDHVSTS